MTDSYLLLDVGGTFIKIGAASHDGELLHGISVSVPVDSLGGREEVTGAVAEAVREGVGALSSDGRTLAGIGICIPGPFDFGKGIPLMKHKFQSIYGMSLTDYIHSLPEVGNEVPVKFIHDVNAALLGEMFKGNATGYSEVALVTLGTGLGFSYAVGRRIMTGPTGSPVSPIYSIPYKDGILEDYVSKRGFLRAYMEITGKPADPSLTVADIGAMAAEGDPAALETFSSVGRILASELKPKLEENRIGCLLLGGQISRSFRFMEDALKSGLEGLDCLKEVLPARHIGEAAFYGIVASFLHQK